MFANDGFKIRGWDETGLHGEQLIIVFVVMYFRAKL